MGLLVFFLFSPITVWLLRRDNRSRTGISGALWLPTFWAAIALSRPLSMWLGFGGGTDTLEGSPLDRMLHFSVICYALIILSRRQLNWGTIVSDSWPIFFFYGYFLITVLWAEPPMVSFKRWFKDLGLVFISLVILTERNPMEAIRAVFVRCAYVLLPLSVIFIRWFPNLGRFYSSHGGDGEITGVATQKNSLGITAMICGLMFLWDWMEHRMNAATAQRNSRWEKKIFLIAMATSVYLIHLSQSKTSLICFLVGAALIAASYVKAWSAALQKAGNYVLLAVSSFYLLDGFFGLTERMLGMLGRDLTFTGRTDVWRDILALNTDPIIGTGFCNFWSNQFYLSMLPFVAGSAHNGYLDVYLDGGWIGVCVLAVMLIAIWVRISAHLKTGDQYDMVRLAVYLAIVIGSFSESHFGRLGPLWFLFILTAIDPRSVAKALPTRSVAAGPRADRVDRSMPLPY